MRGLKNNKSLKGFGVSVNGTGTSDTGRKIIAVDFDGTLVKNRFPFIENPNIELIEFIKKHRNDYVWILWTCREGSQLKYAVDYLKNEHELEFDYINENTPWMIKKYGNARKIHSDLYVDDKSVSGFENMVSVLNTPAGARNDIGENPYQE